MNTGLSTPKIHNLYNTAFALTVFTTVYNIAEGIVSTYFVFEDDSLALLGSGC